MAKEDLVHTILYVKGIKGATAKEVFKELKNDNYTLQEVRKYILDLKRNSKIQVIRKESRENIYQSTDLGIYVERAIKLVKSASNRIKVRTYSDLLKFVLRIIPKESKKGLYAYLDGYSKILEETIKKDKEELYI